MTNPTSAAVKSYELTFRPMEATEHDLALFHDCFVQNGSPRSLDMLRWQYFEPTAGPLLVDLAITQEQTPRLAAIYAVCPMAMHANGRRVLGLQSLNTLTDEAYRGRGLFVTMAAALYQRSVTVGAEMVYGFPNGNSAHGLFKRLAWETLNPMPILFRPLRIGYLLRKVRMGGLARILNFPLARHRSPRLPAGYALRTIAQPDVAFDAVWRAFTTGVGYAVERDAAFLAWRLRRPGANYEIAGLFRNDTLVGFVIIGTTSSASVNVGKLMELVFDPADTKAAQLLMDEAMARLQQKKCDVVWAWNFEHSPNNAALRQVGFRTLPKALQNAGANAGVRAFTPMPDVGNRQQWYLSLLDSDTD